MKKTLSNLIELSSKVAIYVPSTINVDEPVDSSEQVNATLALLSNLFGGATSTRAVGCWVTEQHDLCKESVTVCYSYSDSATLEAHISDVIEYCEELKASMSQEAISLEVNNKLYFI